MNAFNFRSNIAVGGRYQFDELPVTIKAKYDTASGPEALINVELPMVMAVAGYGQNGIIFGLNFQGGS